MAVTLTTFSEADVADWFATRDINKAKPYVDLVRDLEIKGNQLSALVPGSAPQPYIVQAYLSQAQSGEMGIVSRCTCPVGRHCKHVAAVLLKAIEERNPTERTNPSMLSWVDDLRRTSLAVAKKKARPATARQQLFYVLKWTADKRQFGIEIRKGKYPESAEEWWKVDRALVTPPQFVTEEDLGILRLIWADRGHETGLRAFGLGPANGAEILQRMAASHRLYPEDDLGLPLAAGALRPASIGWHIDGQGFQRPLSEAPDSGAERNRTGSGTRHRKWQAGGVVPAGNLRLYHSCQRSFDPAPRLSGHENVPGGFLGEASGQSALQDAL